MAKEKVTMDLEVHMTVTMSKEFLDQFKLDTKGHVFNQKPVVATENNNYLGSIIVTSCFRNNARSIYHAKVKNIRGDNESLDRL